MLRRNPDRGSAVPVYLAVLALGALVFTAVIVLAKATMLRAETQRAADLSALAAAQAWNNEANPQPCELAKEVSTKNGAQLHECQREGEAIQLTATRTFPGTPFTARATARAGPAEYAPTSP